MLLTMQKYLSLPWNKKRPDGAFFLESRVQRAMTTPRRVAPPLWPEGNFRPFFTFVIPAQAGIGSLKLLLFTVAQIFSKNGLITFIK